MIRRVVVALVVVALATLASYAVWLNANAAHRSGVEACKAVDSSNESLVHFLRRELVPIDAHTDHVLTDLAANDAHVYATCLAKVP